MKNGPSVKYVCLRINAVCTRHPVPVPIIRLVRLDLN